ncbi:alpha/beta fold hydrolase [Haematobacter missouriensis]|uniref:AB hydrolase-1 domain-containing protein n=1 Tax=Haematobacter missouriensis TaxID=366616 RepID=A0A212APK7_9RHOB|nr:alpha/beta hydrolase [Haematobacter missouriensis]OWJ76044.1 hypothetical protein CDV53_09030 [Haematobacter missouriensis]OWJ83383.1 hypothetical protein CDV52_11095 [Haematobacter missouriensis]
MEHRVSSGGALLHIAERGAPEGRAMLFLHGGLGALREMAPLAAEFPKARCLLMDTRGHGASSLGQGRLTYQHLADDAAAVISALGLERPLVIGHSDGGVIALELAARGPSLAGVVSIGGSVAPPPPQAAAKFFLPLTAEFWRNRFPEDVASYEAENPAPDFERLFDLVKALWLDGGPGNYPVGIERIALPVLILNGDADELVSRLETVALAEAIPSAALALIPYAGHMVHMEQSGLVAHAIRAMLDRLA